MKINLHNDTRSRTQQNFEDDLLYNEKLKCCKIVVRFLVSKDVVYLGPPLKHNGDKDFPTSPDCVYNQDQETCELGTVTTVKHTKGKTLIPMSILPFSPAGEK